MSTSGFDFHIPDSRRWTRGASCAELYAAYMFPSSNDTVGIEMAKAECRGCPVREECLTEALERNEPHGVWGGMTTEERRDLSARKARRANSLRKAEAAAAALSQLTVEEVSR